MDKKSEGSDSVRMELLITPRNSCREGCPCVEAIIGTLTIGQRCDLFKALNEGVEEAPHEGVVLLDNHHHMYRHRLRPEERENGWYESLLRIAKSKTGAPHGSLARAVFRRLKEMRGKA